MSETFVYIDVAGSWSSCNLFFHQLGAVFLLFLTGKKVGEGLPLQEYKNLSGMYVKGNKMAMIDYNGHVQLYYIEYE